LLSEFAEIKNRGREFLEPVKLADRGLYN